MKLKNIIISALAVATLASCVDLDYSEVTTNDEQWVYQSPNYGIQRLVTSLYARIPNGIDKNFEGGSGATFAAACDEADCALSNSNVRKLAIAEANNYLEKQYKIDMSAYENNNDYQAMKSKFELFEYEARFLRAWFYFELVRTYGDVPFTLKSLTNDQANSLSRTPAVEVMDWIVAEMDRIAEYLPVTYTTELNTDIGRATKPMCLALKARTLLYKASPLFNTAGRKDWWLDAARATHDLLVRADGWGIKLGKYASIWGPDNGDGTEVIFAEKQGALSSWEKYNYPVGVENGQSGMCPTQTLVDAYEYQDSRETFGSRHAAQTINLSTSNPYEGLDPRFAMTVVKNGDLWPNYNTSPIEIFEGGLNASPLTNATQTGYYLKKYCNPSTVIGATGANAFYHNWVVFRLAEMYLNLAEAMLNYTGSGYATSDGLPMSAAAALNVVRTRAGQPNIEEGLSAAAFKQKVENERFVELAFEGHRFYDVRRWKEAPQYLTNIRKMDIRLNADSTFTYTPGKLEQRQWDDKMYFFPIPQSEIQKAGSLTQNPGW